MVATQASGGLGLLSQSNNHFGVPFAFVAAELAYQKCCVLGNMDSQGASSSTALQSENSCTFDDWNALQRAWVPFSMAFKRVWWEAVATPSDIEPDDFREQLKCVRTTSVILVCVLFLAI